MPKYSKEKHNTPYNSSRKTTNVADKENPTQGTDLVEESLGCNF